MLAGDLEVAVAAPGNPAWAAIVWACIRHSIGVCAGAMMTSRAVSREQSWASSVPAQTRATESNSDMTDLSFE